MKSTIDGILFKQMILHGAAAITLQKQKINDLNVFPVPDGDTGTNMSMTINTASTELKKSSPETVDQASKICASALLRGARGNSGVILSLLFRGINKGLKGMEAADGKTFAAAMQEGVAAAYNAVMKPAEGTVLTVSRLAAKRAAEAAAENNNAQYVLEEAIKMGYEVLPQTTEMNPVLKKANVVDAGAKGYLVILEGMLSAMKGEPMPEMAEESGEENTIDYGAIAAEEITFTFDTVFIVRKANPNIDLTPLRTYLNSIGDSLVIGEDDDAFKVHVHTDIPGDALNEGQKYGILELAKIENMRTQAEDMAAGRKTQSVDDLDDSTDMPASEEPAIAAPEKRYGFLSVCAGDGIADVFRDLGVDGIISGGQTMNPSTESILNAINRTPAEVVFVLPNNKNIIMAAQQCIGLSEKEVIVVPSTTIPQGITAMMNVDLEAEPQEIADTMTASMEAVTTAQITYAARNSDFDGFEIQEGDYMTLLGGKLFGSDRDISVQLKQLAEEAANRSAEFLTIFYGEDVTEEEAAAAEAIFAECCPDAELSMLPGGQPVYYYIVSIE